MEHAGQAIAEFKKTGWSRWGSGIIGAALPWVYTCFIYFKSESFPGDFGLLALLLSVSVMFFLCEDSNFTSITLYEDSLVVSRLLKRPVTISYAEMESVRSWNYYGEYLRPSLKFSLKDGKGIKFVGHQFSKALLNKLFVELDEKNVDVLLH
jgi:hypothetical protein